MKKSLFTIVISFLIFNLSGQTSHTINSGDFYYTPQILTIDVGDDVSWINDGGFHNVNFDINSITGSSFSNPESFSSLATNDVAMYTHVFTFPGIYEYDCSVGSHAANGMVGTITVNSIPAAVVNLAVSDKSKFKIYNMLGFEVSAINCGPIIYKYEDGTVEKRVIIK